VKGAYHFYRSAEDPVKQAEEFVKLINDKLEDDDLPPILDFEELQEHAAVKDIDSVTTDLKAFLSIVQEKTGRKPIFYTFTNHWYWKGLQARNSENPFKDYPLWVANYSHTWDHADGILPYGFTGWNIWQYSDKGKIDGIDKATDLSWFKGSEDDLKQFILSTKVLVKE
jgi:lysozyme